MGPPTQISPGGLSMKVEYLQGFGRAFHTHKASNAGTSEFTWWRAYMPATIVIPRGLVQPPPWYGWHFPSVRQGVKSFIKIK